MLFSVRHYHLTIDLGSASADGVAAFQIISYDPANARESVSGWIALSLIALLALVIGVSFAFMWVHPDGTRDLHDLLALLLGPLVALVGAATGYYFGSEAGRQPVEVPLNRARHLEGEPAQ